jgi:hypothetical protein
MIVNKEHFTHDKMKDKLVDIVDSILSDVPQEVKIKLPSLKSTNSKKLKLPKLKG